MSSKSRWWVILVVLGLAAFHLSNAFAAGGGAKVSSGTGRGTAAACRASHGNSGQHPPAQYGRFCNAWGYRKSYWGWNGFGLGFIYPWWGYPLEGVPYFSPFPPVYYGNGENLPVVDSSVRTSWFGSDSGQPVPMPAVSTSSPHPPLRIINPYYVEENAENRFTPIR